MIKTNAKVGAWLNDWQMNKCKVVVLVKDCDAPDARGIISSENVVNMLKIEKISTH